MKSYSRSAFSTLMFLLILCACLRCDFGLSSLTAPQTWREGGVLEQGSDRGVEKMGAEGGCVRAESAGSFTNRSGSSVNGVNEEWEQAECAEMKEVPPH